MTLPIVLSLGGVVAIVGINAMASKSNPTPVDISSPQELDAKPRVQPDYRKNPSEASKYVRELARRSQGKYETLGEDDRKFLNGMTEGHGKEILANTWKSVSQEKQPGDGTPGKR